MPHIWRACTMVNTRVRPRVHRLSNAWGNTSRTCPQILGYQSGVGRLCNDLLRKVLLKSLKYFTSCLLYDKWLARTPVSDAGHLRAPARGDDGVTSALRRCR